MCEEESESERRERRVGGEWEESEREVEEKREMKIVVERTRRREEKIDTTGCRDSLNKIVLFK